MQTQMPSAETDPPISGKFYVRSGQLSVVLTSGGGPLGAAKKFCARAFQHGQMSHIGNFIEVSESGRFNSGEIILRRETCSFLLNNLGVDDNGLILILARELHKK